MKAWDRPPLRDIEDIRREIEKTPEPKLAPDKRLDLGPCGMGMPVLQSAAALRSMTPGQVLLLTSSHP